MRSPPTPCAFLAPPLRPLGGQPNTPRAKTSFRGPPTGITLPRLSISTASFATSDAPVPLPVLCHWTSKID